MAQEEHSRAALQLIERRTTLVLATANPSAWAAPVYYVYESGRFWFFSSPKSRHIVDAFDGGGCAGSVYQDSSDWREIEGLQMEGGLEIPTSSMEAARIVGLYVARFPTTLDLLGVSRPVLANFRERLRADLYAFVPTRVFYLNNRAGLGRRTEIHLLD